MKEQILRPHRSRQLELKDDELGNVGKQLHNNVDQRAHIFIMPLAAISWLSLEIQ